MSENVVPGRSKSPIRFDADKLFYLMEAANLDLLLVSSPHNVRYLSGGYYYPLYTRAAYTRRSQYISFVGLHRNGLADSFYVGRPGEREVMAEAGVWIDRCFESDSIGSIPAASKAAEVLGHRQAGAARIGLELSALPADAYETLKRELPGARFIDAVEILDALRAVKRPEEVRLIREGTRRNLDSLKEVFESGWDGATTLELAGEVEKAFSRRGVLYLYALVCAGPDFFRAPSPHRSWKRGRMLHIDTGCTYEGYIAELCRVGYMGEPTRLAEQLLRNCLDLEAAVLKQMKPGLPADELQKSADEFLRHQPHGQQGTFIAHGIGLVHHEDPVVHRDSTAVLETGMVLSLEMEFRHAEAGHVKIEDMVVMTPAGGEILSPDGHSWYLADG